MTEHSVTAANTVASIVLLKGTALAVLCWLLTRFYRRKSSLVSRSWQLATLSLLAIPLLSLLLPAWTLDALAVDHGLLRRELGSEPLQLSVASWLLLVWGAGALVNLSILVRDLLVAARSVGASREERDDRVRGLVHACQEASGATRSLRVVRASGLVSPAVFGWLRPTLLVPPAMAAWPEADIRAALYHELAHVRRHDFLFAVIGSIVRALYWPNPIVRHMTAVSLISSEVACDDAALASGVTPAAYASRLVALARAGRRIAVLQLALPFSGVNGLRHRVAAVMDSRRDRRPADSRQLILAITLALPLLISVAMARGWYCDPAPTRIEFCPPLID